MEERTARAGTRTGFGHNEKINERLMGKIIKAELSG